MQLDDLDLFLEGVDHLAELLGVDVLPVDVVEGVLRGLRAGRRLRVIRSVENELASGFSHFII